MGTGKLSPKPGRNFNNLNGEIAHRSSMQMEHAMARNFGIPRQFNGQARAAVWPLWMMAVLAVAVINAATFLPH